MIRVERFYPLIIEAFNEGRVFTFPINGTSMQPLLHTNDLVTLERISTIKKGDIIFYLRANGQFVLHRVRRIRADGYTFVGDHQTQEEAGIKLEQCIGKAISYKSVRKDKEYNFKGLGYWIYKHLVRFKLFRLICGKLL